MLAAVSDPRFRTFWPRVGASILDTFIVMIPLGIGDWLVWRVVTVPALLGVWFVASSLAFVVYSISLHATSGQTIGKRVARVRVFAASGEPLSPARAVMRDLVPLAAVVWSILAGLPTVLSGVNPADLAAEHEGLSASELLMGSVVAIWGVLELVTMLTNSRRRSVHDFIAGSVVMRVTGRDQVPMQEEAGA